MKKLMFMAVTLSAMVSVAEMKVGTVDLMLLIRNHPNYDANKKSSDFKLVINHIFHDMRHLLLPESNSRIS